MELKDLYPLSLVVVGLVHLIPSLVLVNPGSIETLYGISETDLSLKLIITHRASFFLFLSIFSIVTAFIPKYYDLAFIFCSYSMLSFIILFKLSHVQNPNFLKVFKTDVVSLIFLILSYIIYKFFGD